VNQNQIRCVRCAITRQYSLVLMGIWWQPRRYYEQSLRASPENPRALYGLADIVLELGASEKAKQLGA